MEIKYATSYTEMLVNMKRCFQFSNVDMHEHGLMVNREYTNLLISLDQGLISEVFPEKLIDLYSTNKLLDYDLMMKYQILHDCGKLLCR